jgi:hypothetical protein
MTKEECPAQPGEAAPSGEGSDAKNGWLEIFNTIFFELTLSLSDPIGAALGASTTWHATLLKSLRDTIQHDLANVPGMDEVVSAIDEMINNLSSPDMGKSKGFSCISDYLTELEKIEKLFKQKMEIDQCLTVTRSNPS